MTLEHVPKTKGLPAFNLLVDRPGSQAFTLPFQFAQHNRDIQLSTLK